MDSTIITRKQQIAFPEIGIIRKGEPKRTNEKGAEIVGRDLGQKFRVVFHPGTAGPDGIEASAQFFAHYNTFQPEKILAMLPFRTLDESYTDYDEAYQAGRMVAQADDTHYLTYRNPTTGEYEVTDGKPYREYRHGEVIRYERNNKRYELKMRPYIRLKLWLPVFGRMVFMTLKSTSFYDKVNIRAQFGAIQALADALNGGSVAGIPFWLYRRETEITWNKPDGTASRVKKWLINIEVDPAWVAAAMQRYQRLALGEGGISPLLPAPVTEFHGTEAPEDEDEEDEGDEAGGAADAYSEGEFSAAPEPESQPEPQPLPAANTRPYAPEILRDKLAARVGEFGGEASQAQRGLLVMLLEKCLYADGKSAASLETERKTVTKYLTGAASVKEIPGPMVKCMLQLWLQPKQDSGGDYAPNGNAAQEARRVYEAALVEAGQERLL